MALIITYMRMTHRFISPVQTSMFHIHKSTLVDPPFECLRISNSTHPKPDSWSLFHKSEYFTILPCDATVDPVEQAWDVRVNVSSSYTCPYSTYHLIPSSLSTQNLSNPSALHPSIHSVGFTSLLQEFSNYSKPHLSWPLSMSSVCHI